jgi:hypothetical protein
MFTQALSDIFRDRIITSGISSAHLPNLIPCDSFFWGCLEDKVYNRKPQTKELKENICMETANIPAEQLQSVNLNLFWWCEECLHIQRQHLQHLL